MLTIRHTGIVVSDIEKSLKFYCDFLGLEEISDNEEDSRFIDKILNLSNSKLQTIKLKDSYGGMIELLNFSLLLKNHSYKTGIYNIGCAHIAFTVDNLDETFKKFKRNDIIFKSNPTISPDGKAKVAFCYDPDGIDIELVEVLQKPSKDYISSVYDTKSHPITKYPHQLCKYLFDRFKMREGQKLLDVGCGHGDFTYNFKKLKLNVTGLDISNPNSDFLKDINIKYSNFETEAFPFEDESVDIVFSKSVIEHLNNPTNFLKEIHRVLKKEGIIIIMAPDWVSQMKIYYDDWTHKTPYTTKSMNDVLKMFGFKNIKTELFYQLPVLWKIPQLKMFGWLIRHLIPITFETKIKIVRWSRELMIIGYGRK